MYCFWTSIDMWWSEQHYTNILLLGLNDDTSSWNKIYINSWIIRRCFESQVSLFSIVTRWSVNYENNQQNALYRLMYYFKSALHVSGDVFAHHQEHLTVCTVSGSVHASFCRLVSRTMHASQSTYFSFSSFETPAGSNLGEHYQIL
jgi:hypothetical protein